MITPEAFEDLPADTREQLEALEAAIEDATPEEVRHAWQNLSERHPGYAPARLNYVAALLETGDTDGARRACEAAREDFGPRPEVVVQMARVSLAVGRHEEAISYADFALSNGYAGSSAHITRSQALLALDRTQEAEAALLSAYEREPQQWRVLEKYCALTGRPFVPPVDDPPAPADPLAREWLYYAIESAFAERDRTCDHTFSLVRQWADRASVDAVALYQFLNARGAFCDCEVSLNAKPSDSVYESLFVTAGVVGSDYALRKMLLENGGQAEPPPPLAHPSTVDRSDSPMPFVAIDGPLVLPPQAMSGQQWGQTLECVAETLPKDATFWAIVIAPHDDRTQRLFIINEGRHRGWFYEDEPWPDDAPTALKKPVEAAAELLVAALPPPPPTSWEAPLRLLAPRTTPRVLFRGEHGLRMAYGDGSDARNLDVEGFDPTPSPDGQFFAYTTFGPVTTVVLADVDLDLHRVVARCESIDSLVWVSNTELHVDNDRYEVDPKNIRLIESESAEPRPADEAQIWHRDREWIIFTEVIDGHHQVSAFDVARGTVSALTDASTCSAYWPQRTDRYVVFGHSEGGPSGPSRIARVPLEGGPIEMLTEGPNDEHPAVHASGWLAYQRRNATHTQIVCRAPDRTEHVLAGPGEEPIWWP